MNYNNEEKKVMLSKKSVKFKGLPLFMALGERAAEIKRNRGGDVISLGPLGEPTWDTPLSPICAEGIRAHPERDIPNTLPPSGSQKLKRGLLQKNTQKMA